MKKWMLLMVFVVGVMESGRGQVDSAAIKEVDSLLQVSRTLTGQRNYDKALEVIAVAEKLALEKLGRESVAYGKCCNSLGTLYANKGNHLEAEKWFLESKAIREKVLGKEHPDYAMTMNNLANVFVAMGKYEKAEPLYLEVIVIQAKVLGKEHRNYAWTLNNLAGLYLKMGDYASAESLYYEAKAIQEKVLGKEHPDYAQSLNNLAILYRNMGNYEKAEPLYLEANAIREKALGKEHPDYAQSLNNLAGLYRKMGKYEKAEPLYLQAKAIREKALGREHPYYAASLNNLANLYRDMGNYEKSELLHLEAKPIYEKVFGKEHPDYAESLNNLASLYGEIGNYEKAEPLFLEAEAIRQKVLGKQHPDYATNLNDLAILYGEIGNYEKAELLYRELSKLNQSLITKALHHLSERELNNYLHTFSEAQAQTLSFAQKTITDKSNISQTCYDNTLFYKGFLLNALNKIKYLAQSDSASTEKFNLLKSCERRLAREHTKPIAERDSVNVVNLETQSNELQKDLARSVAGYAEAVRQVRWQDVQKALKANEVAVEFVHYPYHGKTPTDSTFYAALLLRSGWEQPHFVLLFEEKELSKYSSCLGIGDSECAAKRYSQKNVSPLFRLLWKPLDSLLAGVKTIYYAPTGELHLLDFGALNTGGNKTLSDRYRLVRLGSTRSLAEGTKASQLTFPNDETSAKPQNLALLFGGVRYEADSTDLVNAVKNLDTARFFNLRGMDWGFLEGSQKEVENIKPLLETNEIPTHTFLGIDATEEAFKRIGQNTPPPRILHLATHGFFYPNPDSEKGRMGVKKERSVVREAPAFAMSEHPMIRSGLVMAGANYAWRYGKPFREGMEDGILTAYEISQMNLRGTELVVLSACQTGLGDLHSNEGVYGLQRAFKIAGARYLIMSLQRVPDGPTQEFMTLLYKKCLPAGQAGLGKKLPLPDAFRAAQSAMRKKYPDQPLNWSGWVLVE